MIARATIVALLLVLGTAAVWTPPAQAETAAERRERQKQEREEKAQQRKQAAEQRKQEAEQRRQRVREPRQKQGAGQPDQQPPMDERPAEPGEVTIENDLTGDRAPATAEQQSARRTVRSAADASTIDRSRYGFVLEKPQGWKEMPGESGVLVGIVFADLEPGRRETAVLRVHRMKASEGQPLSAYALAWQKQALARAAFKYEEPRPAELDGVEALLVTGTGRERETEINARAVFAIHDGHVYMIETFVPTRMADQVVPGVLEIEQSLKWREVPKPLIAPPATKPAS